MSSPGGSVYQGYKIYHKLKSLTVPKECIIEGSCMSIATLCALACDKIVALNPSRYMIHLPYMGIEGNSIELENGARELQMIENEMIQAYQAKTKLPEDQLRNMMKEEKYMDADEARQLGFVDEVDNRTLKAVAFGKTRKMKVDKNIFDNLGERIALAFKDVFGNEPKAMEMQTDKGMIMIDAEDGVIEGKPVTIDGQPAPDGDYTMDDGKVITVSGGMVAAVKEAAPPAPAPAPEESADEKIKKMQEQLASIKAELDAANVAKSETEQKLVAAEAQNAKAREAMNMIKTEFEDLKKKTIGDPEPPKGPVNHERKPAGEQKPDHWQEETLAFLNENLPHLMKK